jgi:hypothetical protein
MQGLQKGILKYKEGEWSQHRSVICAAPTSSSCCCSQLLCVAYSGLELGSSDEDVCPTCLESYTEGAQAITHCVSHLQYSLHSCHMLACHDVLHADAVLNAPLQRTRKLRASAATTSTSAASLSGSTCARRAQSAAAEWSSRSCSRGAPTPGKNRQACPWSASTWTAPSMHRSCVVVHIRGMGTLPPLTLEHRQLAAVG